MKEIYPVAVNAVQSQSAAQVQQSQDAGPASSQNKTQPKQSSALPQDTVTLSAAAKQQSAATQQTKNGVPQQTPQTGDVDHDGDSH
jgi:hypothetical protein